MGDKFILSVIQPFTIDTMPSNNGLNISGDSILLRVNRPLRVNRYLPDAGDSGQQVDRDARTIGSNL